MEYKTWSQVQLTKDSDDLNHGKCSLKSAVVLVWLIIFWLNGLTIFFKIKVCFSKHDHMLCLSNIEKMLKTVPQYFPVISWNALSMCSSSCPSICRRLSFFQRITWVFCQWLLFGMLSLYRLSQLLPHGKLSFVLGSMRHCAPSDHCAKQMQLKLHFRFSRPDSEVVN